MGVGVGVTWHGHEILKPPLPSVQSLGIKNFNQCFHTNSPILLLSTTIKYGKGGQIITLQNRLFNSFKIVSRSESVYFFLTREGFHKLNSRIKRFPL